MGTRSVVALPLDGGFKGRYTHWDGYPTGVGSSLLAIIARDGVETARRVLTEENYGWSSLNPHQPAEFNTPVEGDYSIQHTDPGHGDGRFRSVQGYGTAYTTVQNQSSPDEWITDTSDDWGTEWAYVLNDTHLVVLERRWGSDGSDDGHMTGMFGVGAGASEGWWKIIGTHDYRAVDTMASLEDLARRQDVTP